MILAPLQGGMLVFALPWVTLRSPPARIVSPLAGFQSESLRDWITMETLRRENLASLQNTLLFNELSVFICVHLWFFLFDTKKGKEGKTSFPKKSLSLDNLSFQKGDKRGTFISLRRTFRLPVFAVRPKPRGHQDR